MEEMWATPKDVWYWNSDKEFHYIIFTPRAKLDEPCLSILIRNLVWIDAVSNYRDYVRGLADEPLRKWKKIKLYCELS